MKKKAESYPGQKLSALMRTMSPGDYRALQDALYKPEVFSAAFLARLLRSEGHDIGVTTVKEWRTHHLNVLQGGIATPMTY